MPNHIHLLLEPVREDQNLAYFMKHIIQRYAQYINRWHQRTGTLWEGRFKSSPISTDYYLLACCRYIEMNAVRAGIIKRPEQYDFSSYRSKVGLERFDFLDEGFRERIESALGRRFEIKKAGRKLKM